MTPDEIQTLQHVGAVNVVNVVLLFLMTLLFGIYLLMFPISIFVLVRRGFWSKSAIITITAISLMFLTTTLYIVADVIIIITLNRSALINRPELPINLRMKAANADVASLVVVQAWPGNLNIIFGDAIAVWRANVLWPKSLLVKYGTFILLIATAAIAINNSVKASVLGTTQTSSVAGIISLNTINYFLSIACNFVATSLIALKAWYHRKSMAQPGGHPLRSRATKVLMLLVESGVIYLSIQLVTAVLSIVDRGAINSPLDIATRTFGDGLVIISAIYPTAVITMVAIGRSVADYTSQDEVDLPHSRVSSLLPSFGLRSWRSRSVDVGRNPSTYSGQYPFSNAISVERSSVKALEMEDKVENSGPRSQYSDDRSSSSGARSLWVQR